MDELIDALMDIIERKRERDKAYESCESSWGYYGHDIEDKLQKSKERFAKALHKIIVENTYHDGPCK